MDYIGHFKINGATYEVLDDKPRDIINIFYKNISTNDVECWSFYKDNIGKEKGKNTITKIKNHWIRILQTSEKMLNFLDLKPFLQTFPMEFWYDFVIPIKKGEDTNMTVEVLPSNDIEYRN